MYILIDGRASKVYDLRPGMNVKVNLEDDEIVGLVTVKTEKTNQIIGTIKYVNTTLQIVTITQYDAVQQKEIEKKVYVGAAEITNVSLNRLALSQLKAGDQITVFGSEDVDSINASLIIVNK